ncbi:hypothetical protein DSM112329_04485 [Paraconexibacter sp. AEG42_29]|uniref:Peptidase S53 domain-containing protein n=1 Tax=Paraconexibacter sp. AEG42_29 TaxID=2997339 RepID=A0AAU7B0W8_9ACTN
MSPSARPVTALAAAAAAALAVVVAAAAPAAAATAPPAGTRAIRGTVPAYATRAPDLGPTADLTPVRALIALRHRDPAGLDRLIAAVSDPHSPHYGDYLSPAEFEQRFAPTDASVAAVAKAARAAGLTVAAAPRNNAYVMVSGTAAQARALFGTALRDFSYAGSRVHAPRAAVRLPASIAGLVADVKGLDTADVAERHADPPPAFVNAPPCSESWASTTSTAPIPDGFTEPLPNVPCGYTPKQLQGAYGITPAVRAGLDGTGIRVAIIDAFSSPLIQEDVAQWSRNRGLPVPQIEIHDNLLQRTTPQGPSLPPTDTPLDTLSPIGLGILDPHGWSGEQTLDIEAVHAMAPGATLVYQGANTALNMDINVAQNNVVSQNLAQIVSNSYGGTTDDLDEASDNIWRQAAAQGIGAYFSSGDDGDETMGTGDPKLKTVGAGANSPFVTAVGGTTLAVGPQDEHQFETYWGTFTATLKDGAFGTPVFNAGGGGGTSQSYALPAYQKGVVPDGFGSYWKGRPEALTDAKIPGRVVPDVAMVGDTNSGFLMGQTQNHSAYRNLGGNTLPGDETRYSEYRIGGTSLSAPLFAGMMALADQAAGRAHGFANPALYAARPAGAFRDISSPTKRVAVIRTNYVNATNADGGTETVLRTANNLGSLKSVPGYDDSTGLGSPLGLPFLRALAPGSKLIPADPAVVPACTPPAAVRFALSTGAGAGKRIVSLQVRVGRALVVNRRGRRLTAVTVKLPKDRPTFSVVIRTRTSSGLVVTSTRTFTESGCRRGAVTVKRTTSTLRG